MMIRNLTNRITGHQLKTEAGFTLLETLVSMTLGVFLLGGVISSFASTKSSDKTRMAISEMDANARIAMQALRQSIAHAGYPSIRNVILDKPFYSRGEGPTTNRICRNGIKMSPHDGWIPKAGQYTRDRELHRGDVITVTHMADNPCVTGKDSCSDPVDVDSDALVYSDCTGGGILRDKRSVACSIDEELGMTNPRNAKIYSTYYLGNPSNEAQKGILYCRGTRGGVQPLAGNIQSMQVLYGVVFDRGTDDESYRYLRANEVEKGTNKAWGGDDDYWGMVDKIKIGLLMYSSENFLTQKESQSSYILLGEKINISSEERHRLYRVYNNTIYLPNMNKGTL